MKSKERKTTCGFKYYSSFHVPIPRAGRSADRFPDVARHFYLLQKAQHSSLAHPAPHSIGAVGKAAGA